MTHKIYAVTDLGPGDGGKGGVVHKISTMMRAHTIIKRGGAQGSHGVCTSRGEQFAFSQWGCGTFEGTPTHLSEQMVISPEGLLTEATVLRYEHGIYDPFALLTVDERALCATPFHGVASCLKELARRDNPRGTVGTGVGVAYRSYQQLPELAIVAGDLKRPGLRDRLAAIRQHLQDQLQPIIEGEFLPHDSAELEQQLWLLRDDRFLNYVTARFAAAAKQVKVVSRDYLREVILTQKGAAIVETSHGVLTDRHMGFHPHTSAIRTLPSFTTRMLEEAGFDGQIVHLGVTRAYAVRHGAGPMPTADPAMTDYLLPGSAKAANRYQGEIRVGPLDLVLLRYAIEACGGPAVFDGLAITWFDQIQANKVWKVCNRYNGARDPAFFTASGEIRLKHGTSGEYFEHQAALGHKLFECIPQITRLPIDADADQETLYDTCAATMQASLGIPVRMVSFGPTELDKLCK